MFPKELCSLIAIIQFENPGNLVTKTPGVFSFFERSVRSINLVIHSALSVNKQEQKDDCREDDHKRSDDREVPDITGL